MRTSRALILLLAIVVAAGPAQAARWSFGQRLAERGAERRPLLSRRPIDNVPAQRQSNADRSRFSDATPPQQPMPAPPPRPRTLPGDAARRAQAQYGGRVLSVMPTEGGYRVRLLRDGEVSVVTVRD
jgi:hypothetical protein